MIRSGKQIEVEELQVWPNPANNWFKVTGKAIISAKEQ